MSGEDQAGGERAGAWTKVRAFLRRLPFLRRPHFAVFPVMAVLLTIAVAFGMRLGDDVVAQIDPAFRQGPPPKARDVTNDPRPARQGVDYAVAYGWDRGQQAQAEACGDCPAAYGRTAYAPVPQEAYIDPTIEPTWQRPGAASRRPEAIQAGAEDSEEWRRMRRYVYYPVSGDPDVDIPDVPAATRTAAQTVPGDPDGL